MIVRPLIKSICFVNKVYHKHYLKTLYMNTSYFDKEAFCDITKNVFDM